MGLRCVAILAAWISTAAPHARAEILTIATYNVENYVAADRMTEAGFRRDYPKPEVQKRALRTVIAAIRADVLLLQEMGSAPYLEELRRDLRLAGVDYPEAAVVEAADSDRHIAVLSRRSLKRIVRHGAVPFTYFGDAEAVKRGLLEVDVMTSAGTVTIYGLHLKSRFTDRPEDPGSAVRRLAEATAVRDLIWQAQPDPAAALFVIAGDFNDDKASKPVLRLLRRGDDQLAELIPVADSRGDSWTHCYRRVDTYSRVDHVLVSPALRPRVVEARIYDGPGTRDASDHRPVVVMLSLPPENKTGGLEARPGKP